MEKLNVRFATFLGWKPPTKNGDQYDLWRQENVWVDNEQNEHTLLRFHSDWNMLIKVAKELSQQYALFTFTPKVISLIELFEFSIWENDIEKACVVCDELINILTKQSEGEIDTKQIEDGEK